MRRSSFEVSVKTIVFESHCEALACWPDRDRQACRNLFQLICRFVSLPPLPLACAFRERLRARHSARAWKPVTFVVEPTTRQFIARWVLDDPINRDVFETHICKVLIPELRKGDGACHWSVRKIKRTTDPPNAGTERLAGARPVLAAQFILGSPQNERQ